MCWRVSNAGRAHKRAGNKLKQAGALARAQAAAAAREDQQARMRAEMSTKPVDIAIDCERIFNGVEGVYYLFGLVGKVRPHETQSGIIMVYELLDALDETGIRNVARPGTYIPIHALRLDPHRVQWRQRDVEAIAKHFHANVFGDIAKTMRRQHFAEKNEELKAVALKARAEEAAAKAAAQAAARAEEAKKPEEVRSFDERFLALKGLWTMPDGVVISTWNQQDGAHCADVRFAPEGHALYGYTPYIKTAHLSQKENGMHGEKLRDYLRVHLALIENVHALLAA